MLYDFRVLLWRQRRSWLTIQIWIFSTKHVQQQQLDLYSSNNWIFVLVPHLYIIPCTFKGLHTVYASCNFTESCFLTVLTPAAKRKIVSTILFWCQSCCYWMNTSCLQYCDWSLRSLYPTGVQKNSAVERTKIGIPLRFTGKLKVLHVIQILLCL